jgi:hypothetical protein
MKQRLIQIVGLAVTAVYAVVIVWLYATEPRSFKEVATGAEVAAGTEDEFDVGSRHQLKNISLTDLRQHSIY